MDHFLSRFSRDRESRQCLVLNDKCLTNLYHYILVWICFYKIGEIHFLHSGSKCKSRSWLWCIDIKWSPAWTLQRLFYSFSLWQFQSHDMLDSSILNICHFSWSSNVLAKLFSSQNVKINSQTQTNVNTNVIYSKICQLAWYDNTTKYY